SGRKDRPPPHTPVTVAALTGAAAPVDLLTATSWAVPFVKKVTPKRVPSLRKERSAVLLVRPRGPTMVAAALVLSIVTRDTGKFGLAFDVAPYRTFVVGSTARPVTAMGVPPTARLPTRVDAPFVGSIRYSWPAVFPPVAPHS